jgi:hypothetical protein
MFEGLSDDSHTGSGRVVVRECRMPDNWSGGVFRNQLSHELTVEFYNCSDSLGNKWRVWIEGLAGSVRDDDTIFRRGGANDGAEEFSWRLTSRDTTVYPMRAVTTPEIVRRFPGTSAERADWTPGASIEIEIEVLHSAHGSGTGGRLTDEDIWLEAQYFADGGSPGGSPLASFLTNTKGASASAPFGDYFAAAADHSDSTEHWEDLGSPGTPIRQTLSLTVAPSVKGYLHMRVHLAKQNATVYVCPRPTIRS